MNGERETIDRYAALSNMELSDKEQDEIWLNVEQRINCVPQSTPKRRSHILGTSAAAVAAVLIVAGGIYAFANHGLTTKTNAPGVTTASNQPSVTNNTPPPKQAFNYRQYLAFTPLLPSYTAGHQLTHSEVTRYLGTQQTPKMNAISFTAVYGDGFVVTEGRPNDLHLASESTKTTNLTLSNNVRATMQKHDGGESIVFTHGGLLYDVTTINAGVSLQELENVCTSISVPATQTPSVIQMSGVGPQSASELDFKPITAGNFYVPNGYSINVQGSSINIDKNSKSEQFQITYKKGSSYLTIDQSKGNTIDYSQQGTYQGVSVNGVTVQMQNSKPRLPVAIFIVPNTGVETVVYSNISSAELTKVLKSFINAATHNPSK